MPGPTGDGYVVVKIIKGHRYRYRQWSWREPGRPHPRTKCQYLGPVDETEPVPRISATIEPGDVVRATNNHTGQNVEREVLSLKSDALALIEPTSGIPFKYPLTDWSFEILSKRPELKPLQFKVGDQFIDNNDGEVMTITKVLHDKRLYILLGTTGADATVTEKRLLDFSVPAGGRASNAVPTLETALRNRYAASPRGQLASDPQPIRPSPDDILDFGEERMTYNERLASWQSHVDELAAQSKVEAAFALVRAALEVSEAGYRVISDDAHQHGGRGVYGVPSTFPSWVPEHLRRKKLFDRLLVDLTPNRVTYPSRANAHNQRALIHAILDQVDNLAGIDTSAIRGRIMHIYGQRNHRETA